MNSSQLAAGSYTLAEILSQPQCWQDCLRSLEADGQIEKFRSRLDPTVQWLFIGCGSSYYIAQAAAASWTSITGGRAKAMPASELLLFPEGALAEAETCQPVLISRSGHTSEVLKVAEYLESNRDVRTLAISCAGNQPLERIAAYSLCLPAADERSTVMTRSFSSMLVGLQFLAATLAGNEEFLRSLSILPVPAGEALDRLAPAIREFVGRRQFENYVFLAQGPLIGLAAEAQLKVMEMSCSYAQSYHTLEFRHGPKAIVGPSVLVCFLLSESAQDIELEVLQETKALGATTMVVADHAPARVRAHADLLLELDLQLPETVRLPVYAFAGQLVGL
jgi:glucosamine--fructose-6-phosphate aminotransferase (isomerizing)